MKILFHINSLGLGGAERVVSILSNALSKEGHEVLLATEWTAPKEYAIDETITRLDVGLTEAEEGRNRIAKIVLRHTKLRKAIRKVHPDIVISFCVKANYRAAISMFGMKIPLLVSVRNDPKIDYAPHKFSTWFMERKAAGCVFQTEEAREFFSPAFQKRSRIIFNPLNGAFVEEAKQLYASLPRTSEGNILREKEVVSVGRITAQKNHALLVHAFAAIANQFPDYKCRIYGDPENQQIVQKLTSFIQEKGLENRIFLMPPSKQIQKEIVGASLFVLPSDYEGMPNSLIEALALGLPCISTDCPCGGPKMLIAPGTSGLLVPVGDQKALENAMAKCLQDSDISSKLGIEARKIADKVKEEVIVSEWTSYIKQLVSKS